MKYLIKILGTILFFLLFSLIDSCKKDKTTSPIVTTTSVNEISYTTANSGGNVTNEGGDPVISRGVCWSTSADPTITNNKTTESGGLGVFKSNISQLTPTTLYYVRAYATNIAGTGYGNQVSFTTSQIELPSITTVPITSISQSTAVSGGSITVDNGGSVISRGICWSTSQYPTTSDSKTTDGSGIGTYTSTLIGLPPNTTIYVRAYATNSAGTSYGNDLVFKTYTGTMTDIDGNLYNTVTIGIQVWMAENLKTTKYSDNTIIPLVTDATAWSGLLTPAYCLYDNDPTYKATYGALYNFYSITTGKLCPNGWHVPMDGEWTELKNYLGGESLAGGKLKETGTSYWLCQNVGATNESGFTALPGGLRYQSGSFASIGSFGDWWSSTDYYGSEIFARYEEVFCNNASFNQSYQYKQRGFSVRCLKDN